MQTVRVGFDDDGRLLGLDVEILHDNGAYTPYGIIVPIITSTQLLGPYKPGALRVDFRSLYTNTVIVTPYAAPGVRRACSRWNARWTRSPTTWAGPHEVRAVNFIKPDEMPYDHGLLFRTADR